MNRPTKEAVAAGAKYWWWRPLDDIDDGIELEPMIEWEPVHVKIVELKFKSTMITCFGLWFKRHGFAQPFHVESYPSVYWGGECRRMNDEE